MSKKIDHSYCKINDWIFPFQNFSNEVFVNKKWQKERKSVIILMILKLEVEVENCYWNLYLTTTWKLDTFPFHVHGCWLTWGSHNIYLINTCTNARRSIKAFTYIFDMYTSIYIWWWHLHRCLISRKKLSYIIISNATKTSFVW